MSKADAATARRVTADWAGRFGEFDVWKPLRLMRRIGPVVQGITLDRTTSGDGYFPTAHVHNLTREFPVITLALGQRLVGSSGMQESVRFSRHSDDFMDAAERLAAQSDLSLSTPPAVAEIAKEYISFAVSQQRKGHPPAVDAVEDGILISAAMGDRALTEESLHIARELVGVWPKSRLPLDWNGSGAWISNLEERAANVNQLTAVIEGQVVFHKLTKARVV
ncbi:hypothetical protein ACFCYH_22945 [Streptomyces sp. NPDC056400]|uniref:hypothetical protein n=1 Tax=Streptomyces sp. NPDC056400 TaxID=3345808 RepID=UPI0035DA5AC8